MQFLITPRSNLTYSPIIYNLPPSPVAPDSDNLCWVFVSLQTARLPDELLLVPAHITGVIILERRGL